MAQRRQSRGSRGVNISIETEGAIFDRNVAKNYRNALASSLEEIGELGAGLLESQIAAGGFVATGEFIGTVRAESNRQRGIGYVKVTVGSDKYQSGRPPKIWMERGTRRGVRLRKGVGAFRKTIKIMKSMDFSDIVLPKVKAVLE